MLEKKMLDALNEQINKELYSAYLYLAMAAHFEDVNLSGFASWMRIQAKEEQEHAMKIFDYIYERRGSVKLLPIDAPPTTWESPVAIFENAFEHEVKVTAMIHNLVSIAKELKDYATESFLQWYVDEQVEEEASADAILQQLKMIEGHNAALIMLDKKVGKREG